MIAELQAQLEQTQKELVTTKEQMEVKQMQLERQQELKLQEMR